MFNRGRQTSRGEGPEVLPEPHGQQRRPLLHGRCPRETRCVGAQLTTPVLATKKKKEEKKKEKRREEERRGEERRGEKRREEKSREEKRREEKEK